MFRDRSFEWIVERMKKVPAERSYMIQMRKEEKAVPYEVLAQISQELRAKSKASGLSPSDIAWLRHDEALVLVLLNLAFRQRNLRICGVSTPANVNITQEKITLKLKNELILPDCVKSFLEKDPHREFLIMRFSETETKAGRAVTEVLPVALAQVLEEYIQIHRPLLIPPGHEHGKLFCNRIGRELSADNLRRLVCRITHAHIGKKIPPHLWRSIFAAHALLLAGTGAGGGINFVQRRLWHLDPVTTQKYCQLDYALPGIAALNREFASYASSDVT
jgi:integrase